MGLGRSGVGSRPIPSAADIIIAAPFDDGQEEARWKWPLHVQHSVPLVNVGSSCHIIYEVLLQLAKQYMYRHKSAKQSKM